MPEGMAYVFTEVLKNSIDALIQEHGTWDLDEAPPIHITLRRYTAATAAAGGADSAREGDEAHEALEKSEEGVTAPAESPCEADGEAAKDSGAKLVLGMSVDSCGPSSEGSGHGDGSGETANSAEGSQTGEAQQGGARPDTSSLIQMWVGPSMSTPLGLVQEAPRQADEEFVEIIIRDQGTAASEDMLRGMSHFFFTTQATEFLSYGNSRAHGAKFSGLGVGVPLTGVCIGWMGGSAEWTVKNGGGTTVRLKLPIHGFELRAR